MKITAIFDTDTKEIRVSVEENGLQKPMPDVSSVSFNKTGYSIWQRDKLVASLDGAQAVQQKTRQDIERYFSLLQGCED